MTTPTRPAAISCALKTLAFGIAVLAILAVVGLMFDKVLPWLNECLIEMNTVFWRCWWNWYDNYPATMYWTTWLINFASLLNLAFAICLLAHGDPKNVSNKTIFHLLVSVSIYVLTNR